VKVDKFTEGDTIQVDVNDAELTFSKAKIAVSA
jgi:hypothetical protein